MPLASYTSRSVVSVDQHGKLAGGQICMCQWYAIGLTGQWMLRVDAQRIERMESLVFVVLATHPGRVERVTAAPLLGLTAIEWVIVAFGIVLLVAVGVVAWLLAHLLGQNGRLLGRLDSIEAALEDADIELEEDDEEEEDEALALGSPAPAFSLSGLSGETMTLDALRAREKPVLLLFSDSTCGPCNALMPEVGAWERELANELTVVVISRGSLDVMRQKKSQYNLTHVLMQQDSEVADAYQVAGTPTAVLVRADGMIGSGRAAGADKIRALVRRVSRGQGAVPARAADRAPVAGLASIGKDAPIIELKNLDGKPVQMADFSGHPTAVLFWNPDCGFCRRMVDDLKAWEANPPADAPKLLVVSTGDPDVNRKIGLTSPIVLDADFGVGSSFGVSGTPSAVLVGANGKIASGLAVGGPNVMSLLRA